MYPPKIIGMIKSRRMRQTQNVAGMGENKNAFKASVAKSLKEKPLGIPTHRWYDNNTDIKEIR